MRKSILGAGAFLLLSAGPVIAATPEELYQTWQQDNLHRPEVAETAAEDYLRTAPTGPHAQELQLWLDAYHKAMARLLSGTSAPRQASAAPPPRRQPPAEPGWPARQLRKWHDAYSKAVASLLPATPAHAVAQAAAPPPPERQQPAAAPDWPAQELQKWRDTYRKTMAGLLSGASQRLAQAASSMGQDSAPPSPRREGAAQPAPRAVSPPTPKPAPPVQVASAQAAPSPVPAAPPAASEPPPQPVPPATAPPSPQPAPPAAPPPEAEEASPPDDGVRDKAPDNAEEDSAPAAKPDGQSLTQALAFIADKVEGEGRISVLAQFHDAAGDRDLVEQLSYRASNVTIDPNRCRLAFRWNVGQDGKETSHQNHTVELRLVKSIGVETVDQALTDRGMGAGQPFPVHVDPKAYAVHIARWDNSSGDDLYFRDKDVAARVGEAAQHALALCDDGRARRARQR